MTSSTPWPMYFLCFQEPGSGWAQGIETRRQPLWDEHAEFIDGLFGEGRIFMAGPYTDWSGAMVIVRASSESEARSLFDQDPWAINDILHVSEVRSWYVFLDGHGASREPSEG